jgi:hypothetical protein
VTNSIFSVTISCMYLQERILVGFDFYEWKNKYTVIWNAETKKRIFTAQVSARALVVSYTSCKLKQIVALWQPIRESREWNPAKILRKQKTNMAKLYFIWYALISPVSSHMYYFHTLHSSVARVFYRAYWNESGYSNSDIFCFTRPLQKIPN